MLFLKVSWSIFLAVALLSIEHFLNVCVLTHWLSIDLSLLFLYFIVSELSRKEQVLILACIALVHDGFKGRPIGYSVIYFYVLMHLCRWLIAKTPGLLSVVLLCMTAQWWNEILAFMVLSQQHIVWIKMSFIVTIISTSIVSPIISKLLTVFYLIDDKSRSNYMLI